MVKLFEIIIKSTAVIFEIFYTTQIIKKSRENTKSPSLIPY